MIFSHPLPEQKSWYNCPSCGTKGSVSYVASKAQKLPNCALLQSDCVICGTTVSIAKIENGQVIPLLGGDV